MAFEALLTQADARPKKWRRIALIVSIGLHVAALIAGGIHSIWNVEELPLPAIQVTLAAELPPPPPPPPPPKKKTSSNTQQTKPRPDPKQLVQPTETQKVEEKKEEAEDAGDDKGEEGGVEGGVAGGVVGGVVGNQPPPAPPKATGPKQLSSVQGRKQLAVNTQVPPYRMNPPKALQGMKFVAAFMVCVNEQGGTMGLKLTRSSGNPTIDNLMKRAVGSWKYRPFVENGVAMKFCWNPVYVHDERS
jgi:protein TonB